MSDNIRWGILGPGAISEKFAVGLQAARNGQLVAVGSRDKERAERFAQKYAAASAYGSYQALVEDPAVDAIYIGTPHSFHKEHTLLALKHGKHVLCEKPFAINRQEAREMVEAARYHQLFLMEAMWTRFVPAMVKARELIAEGVIGEVRMLQADFGFRTEVDPRSRLFNLSLGGGGLLDVGIYPISLAHMLFGPPTQVKSMANIGSTGVDEEAAFLLGYAGGEMAIGSTAVRLNTSHTAYVLGTQGSIFLDAPWWITDRLTLKRNGETETLTLPFKGNGYTHEAEAVADCITAGQLESTVMSLADSLEIMGTLDQLRGQWGLVYPSDK